MAIYNVTLVGNDMRPYNLTTERVNAPSRKGAAKRYAENCELAGQDYIVVRVTQDDVDSVSHYRLTARVVIDAESIAL